MAKHFKKLLKREEVVIMCLMFLREFIE